MSIIMKNLFFLISFLSVFCLTACNHNNDIYQLLQAERMFESDTTAALKLLYKVPTKTFHSPGFSYFHDVSCIENVYYSKVLHHIETGDIEKAQELIGNLIKDVILYNNNATLLKDEESGIIETPLLLYKKLVLINSSANNDDLLLEIKELLKQCIYQQINGHQDNKTLFIEYKLINNKYYFYILLSVTTLLILIVYQKYKSSEIHNMGLKLFRNENKLMTLSQQIQKYQHNTMHHLGIGKSIFESIKDGGTMKNISIENEQSFIDYYAFCFPQDYMDILSKYKSLSLRHTSYLILKKMNFLDKDIKRILFVQDSTIRNYRLRIKKQLK